jgi:hypothetical protein
MAPPGAGAVTPKEVPRAVVANDPATTVKGLFLSLATVKTACPSNRLSLWVIPKESVYCRDE